MKPRLVALGAGRAGVRDTMLLARADKLTNPPMARVVNASKNARLK